ncbi:PH domain-containing protein [Streptomyces sp. NPDC048288]|uniref:PH domain-containing protein n=1 Tax=Streptomyces sp. NPDC048288 TaxID=3365529 RepID=UPI00371A509D
MGEAGAGVERVYRRRRRLPGRYFVGAGSMLVVAVLQVLGDDSRMRDWGALWFGLVLAVILVMVPLNQFRAHTRVTATGITAQGVLRSRTWAWHEVYDIRVEHVAGNGGGVTYPEWVVHLYDFEGRRFLLPHLNNWQVDDPYAEVSDLCLAAAPYRSLTWERRPRTEELIVRRTAWRKRWTWVVALGVVAAIVAAVLVFD